MTTSGEAPRTADCTCSGTENPPLPAEMDPACPVHGIADDVISPDNRIYDERKPQVEGGVTLLADYEERPATEREKAISPFWESWAMECLDNEQISHCGHLDSAVIVTGCQYCDELTRHAPHARDKPEPGCLDCLPWITEDRESRKWLGERYRPNGDITADLLHRAVRYRGRSYLLRRVFGPDAWALTADLADPTTGYVVQSARLTDVQSTQDPHRY